MTDHMIVNSDCIVQCFCIPQKTLNVQKGEISKFVLSQFCYKAQLTCHILFIDC